MTNTRRFSRVDFKMEASIKSGQSEIRGEIRDISLHGLFVNTTEAIPVGTAVEINISLSNTPPCIIVCLNGVVVRSVEDGIGCTFERIDAESFAHLRNIIAYQIGDDTKAMAEFFDFLKHHKPANDRSERE